MRSMKLFLFFLILFESKLSLAYIFNKCASLQDNSSLKVLNTLNGRLNGECHTIPVTYSEGATIQTDVISWLSVPYAEPPVKQNRFKMPVPIKSWNETIDATSWPKICIQKDIRSVFLSEDCLFLNIFTRLDSYLARNFSLSPILVFIHGGAFVSGSPLNDIYEPSTLVARSGIIVVLISYRLDSFGFLHLAGTESTGNYGFLDQNLAIKWVYDNAFSFGGDKNKITIGGQSAGS